MVRKITFYENAGYVIDGATYTDLASLGLSPKQFEWISELRITVNGKHCPVFKVSHKAIRAANIVGYFGYDEIRLQVLPKLYNKEVSQAHHTHSAQKNLIFMLQKSSEASIWTGDDSPQNEAADSLLESLVWIYVKRLNVYMMHGMKKNYKEVVGHSSKVRGRILFTEKVFSPKSLINPLCQWDEWTENTPLNQSILLLTKHLAKSIASLSLKGNLSSQIARLQQSVEVGKNYDPLLADVNCSRSRYQSSFIQLAKFLAQNISPAMSHGRKNQICIGLDMSQVFEAYIYGLLKRFKDQLELRKVEYQEGLRLISHVSGLEGHYAPTKAKLKNTFVDILVIDKSGKKFVLDAKYKILDDEKKSLGLANSDIYQLTTYQRIHSEQCTEAFGILIYPTSFSDPVRFFRLNAEQDVWFGSHTIDLLCDLKRSEHLIVSGLKETFRAARRLRSLES